MVVAIDLYLMRKTNEKKNYRWIERASGGWRGIDWVSFEKAQWKSFVNLMPNRIQIGKSKYSSCEKGVGCVLAEEKSKFIELNAKKMLNEFQWIRICVPMIRYSLTRLSEADGQSERRRIRTNVWKCPKRMSANMLCMVILIKSIV